MPYRTFTDAAGTEWQVWDTVPEANDTAMVREGFAQGWLTFECAAEKRRLAPIPAQWEAVSEATLARYCAEAAPTQPTKPIS